MIVGTDLLYDDDNANALEMTLRDLIGCGGCKHVVMGWRERSGDEASFLARLSDLGTARVVWTAAAAVAGGARNKGVSVLSVS